MKITDREAMFFVSGCIRRIAKEIMEGGLFQDLTTRELAHLLLEYATHDIQR